MKRNLRLIAIFFLLMIARQAISQTTTVPFSYTGGAQSWTVPAGVTSINVDVVGADGGNYYSSTGGCGAEIVCSLAVTPGQVLYLNVGGVGADGSLFGAGRGGQSGPYTSGGDGGATTSSGGGAGGGGASD